MAIPSSLYAEDTSARQTLANGTVLKWTNQVGSLYGLNADTDLSICYCNWNDPDALTIATKTLYNYYESCDASLPDLGPNESGVANNAASGWTRSEAMSPRVRGIYSGVVISNNNNGAHYWGYNPLSSGKYNTGNGDRARFLLDMDINKMIFRISFSAIKLSDLPDADDIAVNPTTTHYPSPVTISLKELYEHPDWYGIVDYSLDGCMVYGEDTADHWRSTALIPSFIQYCPDYIGGYNGKHLYGEYYGSSVLSFNIPNGHITSGGGTFTGPVISHLNEAYVCMHPTEFVMKPSGTYDSIGQAAMSNLQAYYGIETARTADIYTDCEILDLGKMMYILFPYCTVRQTVSPAYKIDYSTLKVYWRKLIKGSAMLDLIASFGLYFSNDSGYDPDTDNLTPETLGDSDKIWLGEMFNDGTTSGRWITDLDSYHGPNKDGKTSNPDYTPGGGGGPSTDEDNDDPIPTTGVPFASGLAHYYVTTAASPVLEQISEAMSTWDIDTSKKDLYRNLISCKLIKPPAPIPSTPGLTFTIYGVQPEYQGSPITITGVSGNPTASFGSYHIPRKFNDFRDYAPYTKCEIFLPYCGWCGLPSHVVGRSVTVDYYTDIIAATCKAVVYCGSNIVAEASGVIGLDIPFASENVGAKMQAANAGLIASTKGALQTAIGVGTMVSTKGQKGVNTLASGLSTYISGFTQMSMAANENWTEINGQTGDGCNLAGSSAIVIKITRPKFGSNATAPYVPDGYAHNIGFTSMKGVTVGSVSGLLIADNVDTSGISGATEREKAEIKRLLETGIIV